MATIHSTEGSRKLDPTLSASGPRSHAQFSPYDWNGGTIMAICGEGYCVLASDTRLATGYNIKSRNIRRTFQIAETTFISAGGCHADVDGLYQNLKYRSEMYRFDNGHDMCTEAAAQLVSNTLYYKRFFPYYALPIVAGIGKEGNGYCAGYDAVGSYIRSRDGYTVNGSAASVAMPILDNLMGKVGVTSGLKEKPKYTADEAVQIMKDVFITVGERDIMCGDAIEIITIVKDGKNQFERFMLKAD